MSPNSPTRVDTARRQFILAAASLGFSIEAAATSNTDKPITFKHAAREIVTSLPAIANTSTIAHSSLQDRPVLVTFFASWCPPCFAEFKHLNKLHSQFANSRLQIIAINVHEPWDNDDTARMTQFISATKPAFPVVKGSKQIRNLFGGINRIPTVYGFDSAGQLQFNFIHAKDSSRTNATYAELEAAALQLLH